MSESQKLSRMEYIWQKVFCCGCFPVAKYKVPGAEPTFFIPVKILCFFALILPAITAYVCIITTFFTQADIISNYSLANCPDIKSGLPPISYSIGSWEPQKQMWMLAVILHLPARLLLTVMEPQIWRERTWQLLAYMAATLEMMGLVFVTIFYVDSFAGFEIHAFFFGLWWAGAIWGMAIDIHMRRVSGQIHEEPYAFRAWLLKSFLMTLFILLSAATSILYPISQRYCLLTVFTIFCLCEYSLVGLNSAFWAVLLVEFTKDFEGFRIDSVRTKRRFLAEYKVAPLPEKKQQQMTISDKEALRVISQY